MQVGIWIVAAEAVAADYDVGVGQPYATVADAVAQAVLEALPDPTVRIFGPGPFTETVTLTQSIVIQGEGVVPVLRPAVPDGSVFTVNAPGGVVEIRRVEIDGASAGRALLLRDGEVLLAAVDVHDTVSATGPGGAIQMAVGADRLTVLDSTFARSATVGSFDGGTIGTLGGDLTVRRTTFDLGAAGDDGGHIGVGTGSGTDLTLEDCTFTNGAATENGGALYLRDGVVDIRRTRFEANIALGGGGGAFLAQATVDLLVEDAELVANAALSGGAIHQVNGGATYTRLLACDNVSSGSGGTFFLAGGIATIENGVFLQNFAQVSGGAAHVAGGVLTFRSNSLSENASLLSGHAVSAAQVGGAMITDSYFGDHPPGSEAVVSMAQDAASVSTSAWWSNVGGNWDLLTQDAGGHEVGDSLIPPPAGGCDLLLMLPPAGSPLEVGASDGGLIGAFGGPNTWPDGDGDGWISLLDCDDTLGSTFPGAPEVPADGVDQDCDLGDVCHADADGDGFGDPGLVQSLDLDCDDPGEAAANDESCAGFDDGADNDLDGVPDGCDLCLGFPDVPDTDGDLVPDECDDCPLDSPDDSDGDGSCDTDDLCPYDPGVCDTGDTAPPTTDTGETGGPEVGDTAAGTADTAAPEDTDLDTDGADTDEVDTDPGPGGVTDRGDDEPDRPAGPAGCGCATGGSVAPPALLGALALVRRRRWASRTRWPGDGPVRLAHHT